MPAIIGTAGHIDHGKTALIKALTGQDTDRLKEEKERGISIDLGFAHFLRPDGSLAGIVDVPGHERFLRNMLAGAHGIDLMLLVVAADDGVMPQTEEHFEILHLLGASRAIAVITKSDLVPPERVDAVREEIEILLAGTSLEGAAVVAVSSRTGQGIDALRAQIETELHSLHRPRAEGLFRLPIDRAFVIKGHGVVVTGTAISGSVAEGDAVRLLPGGEECRVRSVQVHGTDLPRGFAGQRVAVNVSGVERTEVGRGHMLVHPSLTRATDRFDAVIEVRPPAKAALKNHSRVRVYAGTAETLGKIVLLEERAAVAPKERAYCQLVLDEPTAIFFGDRFVLRDQTARRTIGGGRVLQPFAARHRRRHPIAEELRRIGAQTDRAAAASILARLSGETATPIEWLSQALNATREEVVQWLRRSSEIVLLPASGAPEAAVQAQTLAEIETRLLDRLELVHREEPLAPGADLEWLRSQIAPAFPIRLFRDVVDALAKRGSVVRSEATLRLPSHQVKLIGEERELASRAQNLLATGDLTPPDLKQLEASLGVTRKRLLDVLAQLEREGRVARIGPDLYFAREALEKARALAKRHLEEHGELTAAAFRDLIRASRKFSIALLDYFDRTGFTLRVGDVRRLGRG